MQSEKNNASSDRQEVSKNEACEILGVNKNASEEEIKAAYKKLILKNHPDHGGSKYIAQKLNKAKDILLKGDSRNE
ncbi:DnaJ domain-containing protein [Candidatus Jidaibacter acanthamoebae]|uniref:DnaJ domain-containing protein n=1 Tax=Candidatus Jidaibacter acanthamoebae TaxID=86105 RepID=UPI001EFA056B|nr:DnaJ domain-containing protein [Candidatus Jidaibacter acanthamoeba]